MLNDCVCMQYAHAKAHCMPALHTFQCNVPWHAVRACQGTLHVVVVVVFIIYDDDDDDTQQAYGLLTGCPRRNNCEQLAQKADKVRWDRMIAGSALKRSAPRNERL